MRQPSPNTPATSGAAAPGRGLRVAATALVLAAIVIGAPSRADAVPSFARKYQTSCQTCHVAFPKLTPFGEAFRRNGYRFPEGGDEETTEEEPLALGSDSYKKVWPESVWPGQIPGATPISFGIQTGLNFSKGQSMHARLHAGLPDD